MKAYVCKQGVNVMCLYLQLNKTFKDFCENRTCDLCLLSKHFSDDTFEDHIVFIKEGKILFLADEKEIKNYKSCSAASKR